MPATSELTTALKRVVLGLEDDLRARVEADPDLLTDWQQEHKAAVARERTGMSWQAWRDDRVTQAAVAWVLTTVFVRFCEDNQLLTPVWIGGPPHRRQEALDAELAYFRAYPEHTDREWLLQAVEHLRTVKATRDLVESHSPLWTVSPSGKAAKDLVGFWRATTDDGALVHDFTDPELSTRFLGDLYQDLSDYAKKTFALLQTPEFVEEFILDQTLEPALAERPLEGFKLIDPTCGSGHFLLGAFHRLNDRWARHAPGLEVQARVQKALDAVHGVDLNPFAVAIARFRLMVAALQTCGLTSLEQAPAFAFHLAAGDSLLHGGHQLALDFDDFDADSAISGFAYATEDLAALREILTPGRYDAVMGNPPYISVQDPQLKASYKGLYSACHGKWTLSVPFIQRFFELAKPAVGDQPAGWTGQINSNGFMKREFGTKIIEDYLARQDLQLIVDTSGAYIPGHGTPTVILVGRNQAPVGAEVKAVLGVRGEPGQPAVPANGIVWSSIVDHVGEEAFENEFITATRLPRSSLKTHPWSLSGGGAPELLAAIENAGANQLASVIADAGIMSVTGQDDFYMSAPVGRRSHEWPSMPLVEGDALREWSVNRSTDSGWPYDSSYQVVAIDQLGTFGQALRTYRSALDRRRRFGTPMVERGLAWWEWQELYTAKMHTPLTIAFAFVATHNHFVLDRGGKVFKQSAPVLKLPNEATEDDHLALLGVLNSSTACFWLKQNSHNKASAFTPSGMMDQPWSWNYEFTGTTLKDLPLPKHLPLDRARTLDTLAQELSSSAPSALTKRRTPSRGALDDAAHEYVRLRSRMVAEQEELDWDYYRIYGLVDDDLTYKGGVLPPILPGERAFAIALARRVLQGEDASWFTHWNHRYTPTTEIPSHWPEDYQQLVKRRLDLIESDKFIRLLEKPEYKRRWATEPWDKQVERALRGWLLDRLEDPRFWFDAHGRPTPKSVAQLADQVSRDADLVSVLELWTGRKDVPVAKALTSLLEGEAVPFLAAYRLKDSGLRKRQAWEHTWELQRREDAGERVGDIPVPPKYTSADFKKASWWQHRGKLDVPKERFILYPEAGRETDPTMLLGWAGWDHAQQSLALSTIITDREAEGWIDENLVPLVAGLAELQPWVQQWHDETDAAYGVNLADFCAEQLRDRALQVHHTLDQLHDWRPPATTRGRKPKGA